MFNIAMGDCYSFPYAGIIRSGSKGVISALNIKAPHCELVTKLRNFNCKKKAVVKISQPFSYFFKLKIIFLLLIRQQLLFQKYL